MNKIERTLENIFRIGLKIFYYYYFVLSIINLLCFYFKWYNLLNITTILMLIGIIIELFNGYIRGWFGLIGYIIAILISIYFIKNIWLGISVGVSIVNIINIFINKIVGGFLSFMIRKFN